MPRAGWLLPCADQPLAGLPLSWPHPPLPSTPQLPTTASWCLLCQLASWFNAYCLPRTYSNCLEALAAAAGAYHWLRSRGTPASSDQTSSRRGRQAAGAAAAQRRRHQRAWIAWAAASTVVRPSSALFWALPAGAELLRQRGRQRGLLLLDAVGVGGGLLGAAALVDRALYGR